MLKIQQLRVSYGGIQALRGIDLEVPDGKIVTLIGANGAGKSTTLRTISGLVKAESGSIQWNGALPLPSLRPIFFLHRPLLQKYFDQYQSYPHSTL